MIVLAPESVEAVARRVVELLDERQQQPRLVDAGELARILSVSRSTIYDRASELGAIEVGDGDRPRLRFEVETSRAAWTRRQTSEASQPEPPALADVRRRKRPAKAGSGADLLPIRGAQSAPGGDVA